jgi:hypothetical protein
MRRTSFGREVRVDEVAWQAVVCSMVPDRFSRMLSHTIRPTGNQSNSARPPKIKRYIFPVFLITFEST